MTDTPMPRPDEQLLRINGVQLCCHVLGDASAPPMLLIGGAENSMDWWDDDLCARLVAKGRRVIRYDLRDTGRSVTYPPGSPGYGFDDLVDDAAGVLDALADGSAHVVGISMGGEIAQRLAVHRPTYVRTLTLMATSPEGPSAPDLPPITDRLLAAMAEPAPDPDWSDRAAVIDHFVSALRRLTGSFPLDESRAATIAGRVFDRSTRLASGPNHYRIEGGTSVRPRLGEIAAPTLVVHGSEDPLFPIEHGKALRDEIPNARLFAFAGVGHELPPEPSWHILVPELLRHTADQHS